MVWYGMLGLGGRCGKRWASSFRWRYSVICLVYRDDEMRWMEWNNGSGICYGTSVDVSRTRLGSTHGLLVRRRRHIFVFSTLLFLSPLSRPSEVNLSSRSVSCPAASSMLSLPLSRARPTCTDLAPLPTVQRAYGLA